MKTILYYFSTTGNSLKAAKDLNEKLEDTTLVAIPKVMTSELVIIFEKLLTFTLRKVVNFL